MSTDNAAKPAPKKGRSPNYPGIDLADAIERARQMYVLTRHHPANVASLLEHWGYAPKSGQGLVVFAALLKFGLIDDEGRGDERRARLTEDALAFIRDEREDPTDRNRIIQKLALNPPIHRELWAEYEGDLPPSDATLKFDLVQRRGFTDNGAEDFIREFRSTVAFARLSSSGRLPDKGDDDSDDDAEERNDHNDERRREKPRKREHGMTVLSFQISDRLVEVAVSGGPLTKNEIAILRDYLTIQEKIAPESSGRPAVWRAQESDVPVVVTGSLGHGPDGREYVRVQGSSSGIPADEIEELNETE